jgi:hypothetical protein
MIRGKLKAFESEAFNSSLGPREQQRVDKNENRKRVEKYACPFANCRRDG